MRVWKLVSGILSIILFAVVRFACDTFTTSLPVPRLPHLRRYGRCVKAVP